MKTKTQTEIEGDRIFNSIVLSGIICMLMIKFFL